LLSSQGPTVGFPATLATTIDALDNWQAGR